MPVREPLAGELARASRTALREGRPAEALRGLVEARRGGNEGRVAGEIDALMGEIYAHQMEWKKAAESHAEAIRRSPDCADFQILLGDMHRARGQDEKASVAYRRAADLGWGGRAFQGLGVPPDADASALYLDLMKRCLTFLLWDARDGAIEETQWRRPIASLAVLLRRFARRHERAPRSLREFGFDWPAMAFTMIGQARLTNVQDCVEDVLRRGTPGDLIEAGVWRGGVPIFMRAILRAHGVRDRVVWAADSFRGLPVPDVDAYPEDRGYDLSVWESLAVPLAEVRANFERFGLLDEQVRFLEGWFKDTLPDAPIERIAVMRLDGDLYESTMDSLGSLYPKLSPGGYAIIDDYFSAPPCRAAVDAYRRDHGITDEIHKVDWSGAYWQRS